MEVFPQNLNRNASPPPLYVESHTFDELPDEAPVGKFDDEVLPVTNGCPA